MYNTYYYLGLSYVNLDLNKKALDAYKICIKINQNFTPKNTYMSKNTISKFEDNLLENKQD